MNQNIEHIFSVKKFLVLLAAASIAFYAIASGYPILAYVCGFVCGRMYQD